jgi:hypothetical protein
MTTAKSKIWQTKFGPRRVRQALPTLEEALFAAKGITDDFNQQIDIAADLMGVPREQVRTEAMKSKHTTTLQVRTPANDGAVTRSVVVERRVVRRAVQPTRRVGVTGL